MDFTDRYTRSSFLLVQIPAKDVAMFRFLLEAYENLAYFTVLEKNPALLKLVFANESKAEVIAALGDIKRTVPLEWKEWPLNHLEPMLPGE